MASDELEELLDRIKPGWREKITLLPPGQPLEPEPFDGWCEFVVDPTAGWYHPTWCHSADHHEWMHAELERRKRDLENAYATLTQVNQELQEMKERHGE